MALINCPECNREISNKAVSCPNCGMPIEATIFVKPGAHVKKDAGIFADQNRKTCPSCNSDNTQSIKMMCLSGTTSGRSTGVGVSSDLDMGVGRINTNSQTALAARFAPGDSPGSSLAGCGCMSLLLGSVIFVAGFIASAAEFKILGFTIGLGLGGGMFVAGAIKGRKDTPERKKWEAKTKTYETGWICRKCGKTWIP